MKRRVSMVVTLDVGGTGIKASAFCKGRRLFPPRNYPSRSTEDAGTVISNLIEILDEAMAYAEGNRIDGIAMAFPGPFDYDLGIPLMRGLAKYESVYGMRIDREIVARRPDYDVKFTFINDVAAYGIGAVARHGLCGRTAAFTIGTGLGSAFLDGRKVLKGGEGVPENGWVYPIPFRSGTIDDCISARGLLDVARRVAGRAIDGLALDRAARNGDEKAAEAMREFGNLLCEALEPVLKSFCPDNVVLGGNISKSLDLFGTSFKEMVSLLPARLVHDVETSERITEGALMDYKEKTHDYSA